MIEVESVCEMRAYVGARASLDFEISSLNKGAKDCSEQQFSDISNLPSN